MAEQLRFHARTRRGQLTAEVLRDAPPWSEGGEELVGVAVRVGPAELGGRLVQWLTINRARELADALHDMADRAEREAGRVRRGD